MTEVFKPLQDQATLGFGVKPVDFVNIDLINFRLFLRYHLRDFKESLYLLYFTKESCDVLLPTIGLYTTQKYKDVIETRRI